MRLSVGAARSVQGEIRPPSDKSITHRAYMLGACAIGPSVVRTPLMSEDCQATLECLIQMGLRYEPLGEDAFRLYPAAEWREPAAPLDCGNSGTTMRLLSGLIASRPISATMVGDHSLSKRPMKRIAEPLRRMGATVEGDTPPLFIHGGHLHGIRYETPVASAQIKSCVLLAGLRAEGETWVKEPALSRDHTERMLSAVGVRLLEDPSDYLCVGVRGGSVVHPFEVSVPGDISSAAFFMVAASMLPGSDLRLKDVDVNPSRTGILHVLAQAGVPVETLNLRSALGETVADLRVKPALELKPFRIEGELVPRLIDEIPVLAVLASQCHGVSEILDAGELRVKESDRIELVAAGLRAMGAKVETRPDGMAIEGPVKLKGATIDACGDHRIAMAFAVAGLVASGETMIEGAESIATSFPEFEMELWRVSVV